MQGLEEDLRRACLESPCHDLEILKNRITNEDDLDRVLVLLTSLRPVDLALGTWIIKFVANSMLQCYDNLDSSTVTSVFGFFLETSTKRNDLNTFIERITRMVLERDKEIEWDRMGELIERHASGNALLTCLLQKCKSRKPNVIDLTGSKTIGQSSARMEFHLRQGDAEGMARRLINALAISMANPGDRTRRLGLAMLRLCIARMTSREANAFLKEYLDRGNAPALLALANAFPFSIHPSSSSSLHQSLVTLLWTARANLEHPGNEVMQSALEGALHEARREGLHALVPLAAPITHNPGRIIIEAAAKNKVNGFFLFRFPSTQF